MEDQQYNQIVHALNADLPAIKSKKAEAATAQDPSVVVTKEKTLSIPLRPKRKLEDALPTYGYALKHAKVENVTKSLPSQERRVARSSKSKHDDSGKLQSGKSTGNSVGSPQVKDTEVFAPVSEVTALPADMLHHQVGPTKDSPLAFSVTISGYSTLEKHLKNGKFPASYYMPIASAEWNGVLYTIHKRGGKVQSSGRLYGKVTWGELLKFIHREHPTGTNHDDTVALIGGDEPYEYFRVGVSLLFGAD